MGDSESVKAMRCHYEVMEVAMNANVDEIKKQYKKLALKWHPDRNHGQEELATKNFKEISSAYAVLSDPQERKWYDDHREAILRGGDGTKGEGDGQSINIFKYFNSSCYSGPEDGLYGFFGVYKGVFEKIDLQEINGRTGEPIAPVFGDSNMPIADVLQFYNYWENFATKLNFSWEDKYNVLDAPNRQTKRAMEKENQKYRDAGRKEYTAEVRSLAAFVKKRDRRYLAYEAEVQQRRLEEETKKAVQKAEELQRRKEAREKQLAEWQLKQETQEEVEERNKERSRAFLLADNDSDEDDEDGENEEEFYTEEELQAKIRELRLQEEQKQQSKAKKQGKKQQTAIDGEENEDEVDVTAAAPSSGKNKLSKKEKKKKQKARSVFRADEGEDEEEDGSDGENETETPVSIPTTASKTVVEEDGSVNDNNDDEEGDSDEEGAAVLYRCDVCSKSFKSEAQLSQHLSAKVHRKKLQESQKSKKKGSK